MTKLKIDFERDKVRTAFNKSGIKNGIGFNKVCSQLSLYNVMVTTLIDGAKFEYKTKKEINLLKDSINYLDKVQYPKTLKPTKDELGYDFKLDVRVLFKDKHKSAMRCCKVHGIEYPLGSKCPDCDD